MKDDFKYNLKLLDERDRELSQFDAVYTETRKLVRAREQEISDLKIGLDESKLERDREAAR